MNQSYLHFLAGTILAVTCATGVSYSGSRVISQLYETQNDLTDDNSSIDSSSMSYNIKSPNQLRRVRRCRDVSRSKNETEKCGESCPTNCKPVYDLESYAIPFCNKCPNENEPSACKNTTLVFRSSKVMSRGKISLKNAIKVNDKKNNLIHTELTSRSLRDGERFELVGQTKKIGVGLCVESCAFENKIQNIGYRECVSFLGTETTMRTTKRDGAEYEVQMYRDPSRNQGFTYNKQRNCVTHIGDNSNACIDLPNWFKNKKLRAFGFVWDSNYAEIDSTCSDLLSAAPSAIPSSDG